MNTEVVMWAVGMLGGLIGIYVRMETKMKELDVRVKGLEKTDNAMNEKLDRLVEMVNDIRVKIAKNN
jgi:chaperonin cofactor prefoldin